MQCWFTPGFESLLDHGVMLGWYDSNNTLQMMVFQWVFIPWLQRELDAYQDRYFTGFIVVNNSPDTRALPSGLGVAVSKHKCPAFHRLVVICHGSEGEQLEGRGNVTGSAS
ncbi:hypothetical protein BD769DRAFT_1388584 [Suillus cothurnatus]|nr:hypothetical protein BD769DRAFT_1388584 [Suillus cothurnatus]